MSAAAAQRVLLLQIRDQPATERQERDGFLEVSGLPASSFRYWNLLERPEISRRDCDGVDVLVIGGAGAHSVTEPHPFTGPLERLVREWVGEGRPLFGSCFGHQFLAEALGGRVITDAARSEVGTFDLELTAAGAADPWLAGMPRRFPAQFGHHDRVSVLPAGASELAATELCANQAFRVADLPVYGAQFHIELDPRRMIERASAYREGYLPDVDGLERLRRSLRPSPEASTLLRRFLAVAGLAGRR